MTTYYCWQDMRIGYGLTSLDEAGDVAADIEERLGGPVGRFLRATIEVEEPYVDADPEIIERWDHTLTLRCEAPGRLGLWLFGRLADRVWQEAGAFEGDRSWSPL